MSTKEIVPIKHYKSNKDSSKKFRAVKKPDPKRIGDVVKSLDKLDELFNNKQCIVFSNTIIPVSVIYNWQYTQVIRFIKQSSFKEYYKK